MQNHFAHETSGTAGATNARRAQTPAQATRADALKHIAAIEKTRGVRIPDPARYFTNEIARLRERNARESRLAHDSEELTRRRDWMSVEEYFRWTAGVLAWQEAYLAALTS